MDVTDKRGACRWCTSEGETLSRERYARPDARGRDAGRIADEVIAHLGSSIARHGDTGVRGRSPVWCAGLGRADTRRSARRHRRARAAVAWTRRALVT
jgi:hypothetical protein